MQLNLFLDEATVKCEEGLECNNCGTFQPVEQFFRVSSGEIKRRCKTCDKGHKRLIYDLKKVHPYPDKHYLCPICDRSIKEIGRKGQKKLQSWVLDHCHITETFRGWVCSHCNTGLGAFKDDSSKVKKAHEYLKAHEQKT